MKFLNIVKSEIIEEEANNDFFIICLFLFSRKKSNDDEIIFKVSNSILRNINILEKSIKFDIGKLSEIKQNKITTIFKLVPSDGYNNLLLGKDFDFNESSLKEDDLRVMMKALFLIRGYVSNFDSKFYHFEIRTISEYEIDFINFIFNKYEIYLKKQIKQNKTILYVKKATEISDILKIMNCDKSMMLFEDERISRSITSSYQRIEKVEDMNNRKIQDISDVQIKYINILKRNNFISLNEKERTIAEIRLNYPMYSLSDLTYVYNLTKNENYSKSSINNWLKKIVEKGKGEENASK